LYYCPSFRPVSNHSIFGYRALDGKVAVVTGSTSGIGLSIASQLAASGAKVVVNGFGQPQDIQALVSNLKTQHKTDVIYHGADMTKPSEIRDLIATADKVRLARP